MNVVSIHQSSCHETVAVLQHLLDLAKSGQLRGLAVCAKFASQKEEISFTGDYRQYPSQAVNASMRMSWRLTRLQDELELAEQA